jgi:hypothetical protein
LGYAAPPQPTTYATPHEAKQRDQHRGRDNTDPVILGHYEDDINALHKGDHHLLTQQTCGTVLLTLDAGSKKGEMVAVYGGSGLEFMLKELSGEFGQK